MAAALASGLASEMKLVGPPAATRFDGFFTTTTAAVGAAPAAGAAEAAAGKPSATVSEVCTKATERERNEREEECRVVMVGRGIDKAPGPWSRRTTTSRRTFDPPTRAAQPA